MRFGRSLALMRITANNLTRYYYYFVLSWHWSLEELTLNHFCDIVVSSRVTFNAPSSVLTTYKLFISMCVYEVSVCLEVLSGCYV